ncbi:hypothetical protein [Salipiger aestuarii]|nr:hypothetical protein [Salipiger aestuarii]
MRTFINILILAVTALAIASIASTVYLNATSGVPLTNRQLSHDFEDAIQEAQHLAERVQSLEEAMIALVNSDAESLSVGALAEGQKYDSARIDALEENLDLQPRELIEVLLLREKLNSVESDFEETVRAIRVEVDRVFTMGVTLLIALLAAVLLLGLRRSENSK